MQISLSFLNSYPDLETAISDLGYSKQSQKRLLNKNRLSAPIEARQEVLLPIDLLNQKLINPKFDGKLPQILFEDQEFLVLSKPPGIHSLGQKYTDQNTLLNYLREIQPVLLAVGMENPARGFLYRLDQLTSGLMIYCKNQTRWDFLRKNFHTEVTSKQYLAVVEGDFSCDGEHTHTIQPWGPKGAKMKVSSKGVPASCTMTKEKSFEGKSLVKIDLKTGLRHQIRVQLSALGFPIIGDPLYGTGEGKRMYLHCWRYKISGKEFQDDSFLDQLTSSTKTVF